MDNEEEDPDWDELYEEYLAIKQHQVRLAEGSYQLPLEEMVDVEA